MATTTIAQPRTQNQNRGGRRGRGGARGRGGGRAVEAQTIAQGNAPVDAPGPASEAAARLARTAAAAAARAAAEAGDEEEIAACWICAEPVKYWSVSECNHRTCHVCALRLRALYKKTECAFCKESQVSVIFTTSPDATFASFTPDRVPYKDSRLVIYFETEEMMEETMILLRFNCPDPTCDHIAAAGWGDLKLHVRATHGRQMCDLCIRHKKVFSHEHALYTAALLAIHQPSLPAPRSRNGSSRPANPPEQIEGGVHPLCEFCHECFFSSDEMYPHMREQHEECFICKRMEIRDQHFQNYPALERHFNSAHHPCPHSECLAKKFVVFGSAMDLQAHFVEEHGSSMSSKDRRDAMRVQADFAFEDSHALAGRGRRAGHSGGGGGGREPPPGSAPPGPSRGGRRRDFGGQLTDGPSPTPPPPPPRAPSPPHGPPLSDDPEVIQRQARFLARVRAMAPNPQSADLAVRTAIRSFKASESSARDLISTTWNVMDNDVENTATVVNSLVDLLDDDDKKRDLLEAWNSFKIERKREFPDLVPTSVGSGFAGVASGRVINAKNSTALRARGPQTQIWDRVAQAASSNTNSSAGPSTSQRHVPGAYPGPSTPSAAPTPFPALGPSMQPGRGTPSGIAKTAWSASAGTSASPAPAPRAPAPFSVPGPGLSSVGAGKKKSSAPVPNSSAFPTLPSAGGNQRVKVQASGNQSLRNILGEPVPVANPWTPGGEGGSSSANGNGGRADEDAAPTGGKKKKGKGKQTLFTMGTIS